MEAPKREQSPDFKKKKEEVEHLERLIQAQEMLNARILRSLRNELHEAEHAMRQTCTHPDVVSVSPVGFGRWSWDPIETCMECGKEFVA